ncbi:FtsX-like permease family protein [Ekhidna sp.]
MNNQPPKYFLRFFRWFCHPRLQKPIEGDLMELYDERLKEMGKRKADQKFRRDVLQLFRPSIIKPADGTYRLNNYGMFKHNLIISFRSFLRFKNTFLINLLGLASGLASAILILLWVNDELNMDRFSEKDSHRHVQVIHTYPTSGTYHTNANGSTPNPLFEALPKAIPEIDYSFPVKAHASYQGVLTTGENNVRASYQFIGDGYFNVFPADFIQGNKYKALSDKNDIVISEEMALGLFDSTEEAIGQIIELKDEDFGGSYMVTGVFIPISNSSHQSDVLFHYDLFREADYMQWYNGGTQAHLVLKEGVDLAQFNDKIKSFLKTLAPNWEDILYAQPYAEKYLYGKYEQGVPVEGRITYVKLFSIIAIFLLAIACINYMNFSTAKASRRIKEIGVKKAMGAGRKSLIFQYFGESLFMSFISLIMALAIVAILLPQFNEITGKQLAFNLTGNVLGWVLGITSLTGLISGSYPALHLSGFKPVLALKGKLKGDSKGLLIRKALVVFQFSISVILIVSVIVIYKQVEFIQTSNLGYNKDHIITFPREGNLKKDHSAFFSEIRSTPGVVMASHMSGDLPGRVGFSQGYKWEGMGAEDKSLRFYQIRGGYDLIELLGIKIKEGRSFSRDFPTDRDAYLFNEAAIQMTQLAEPIGQKIGNFNTNANTKEVIGVVKNFHFQSFQEEIRPFIFSLTEKSEKFVIKIQEGTEQETIERIRKIYQNYNDGYPFEYTFLDDDYQAIYAAEERITVLSKYFAAIAIVVSCLGLLALTSFSTQQRFKEIAIRKVLGSSNTGIVRLLSSDFTSLVSIAIIIALPIAYYLMKIWLNDFAYRIELTPIYFAAGGALVFLLAVFTITIQTAKSAKVNVTESLRANE